jgi:hypothetical protein
MKAAASFGVIADLRPNSTVPAAELHCGLGHFDGFLSDVGDFLAKLSDGFNSKRKPLECGGTGKEPAVEAVHGLRAAVDVVADVNVARRCGSKLSVKRTHRVRGGVERGYEGSELGLECDGVLGREIGISDEFLVSGIQHGEALGGSGGVDGIG